MISSTEFPAPVGEYVEWLMHEEGITNICVILSECLHKYSAQYPEENIIEMVNYTFLWVETDKLKGG